MTDPSKRRALDRGPTNLGPRERRRRLRSGIASAIVAVLLAAALVLAGAPRAWRLLLFAPSWGAALGFLQYRERT